MNPTLYRALRAASPPVGLTGVALVVAPVLAAAVSGEWRPAGWWLIACGIVLCLLATAADLYRWDRVGRMDTGDATAFLRDRASERLTRETPERGGR